MSRSLKLCLVALLNKPGVTVGRRGVRLNLRFSPWQPRSGAIRDNVPSRVLPSALALAGRRPFTGACFPHTSNQRWWLNRVRHQNLRLPIAPATQR